VQASLGVSRVGSVVGYLKMLTNVQFPLSGVARRDLVPLRGGLLGAPGSDSVTALIFVQSSGRLPDQPASSAFGSFGQALM
jgi:hypothetical protein